MKNHNHKILLAICSTLPLLMMAQNAEKNSLSLGLKYFNNNNQMQYLVVQAKSKIDGKFQQIPNLSVSFYIASETVKENLLGKAVTNEKGEASILIPHTAKAEWNKTKTPNFIVVSEATKKFDEAKGDVTITKAKIKIDTAEGRVINAKVMELKDSIWVPVKGVDLTIGIKRLGDNLNVNETQTYTTDSLGAVSAEFRRENLPGNAANGQLTIVATITDNENYGNLTAEIPAVWGSTYTYHSNFERRTLFARRRHSPIWLELMAYGIIIAVWSVILYLMLQLKKIIKLGA